MKTSVKYNKNIMSVLIALKVSKCLLSISVFTLSKTCNKQFILHYIDPNILILMVMSLYLL